MVARATTMDDILLDIGFTQNEATIYKAFLKAGEATAAEIGRMVGMDKSSAYRATETLEQKGLLIPEPRTKGTTYTAVNPEKLGEILKLKRIQLEAQEQKLGVFIDSLKQELSATQRNPSIKVEKGMESIIEAWQQSLESKEKMIRERFKMRAETFYNNRFVDYINNYYLKERIARRIHIREILEPVKDDPLEKIIQTSKALLKEVRTLPEDLSDNNNIRMWDDTVNIISYDENKEFIVITIKDKYIAMLMKNMYDFIWERSEVYQV